MDSDEQRNYEQAQAAFTQAFEAGYTRGKAELRGGEGLPEVSDNHEIVVPFDHVEDGLYQGSIRHFNAAGRAAGRAVRRIGEAHIVASASNGQSFGPYQWWVRFREKQGR